MNTNLENVCLKFLDRLLELDKQIFCSGDKQKSLHQECIDFEKKWLIDIGAGNIQYHNDVINEFELTKSKLLRNIKKCVVMGSISSGKSTLINALLAKEILPTGFGSTSNCFVEMTASPTNENYLIVNDEIRQIEELKELNNIKSRNHLPNGSRITMYYDKNKCQLLKDNIIIIDVPGYNSIFLHDNSMEEYFNDADVVVLVVNAQSGITTTDEQFFKDFRTKYTKLNVIIVYNFWDFVNPNGDDIPLQEECIMNAQNILCKMLQLTDHEADSFIFFISASERLRILTNFIEPNSESLWKERNESFEQFYNHLQVKMSESLLTKNYKYLLKLKSMVTSSLDQCQNCVSQMKNKRSVLAQNIKSELDNITGFKETFNELIQEKLEEAFELLLIQCLVQMESDKEIDNKNVKLKEFILDFINESLEIIKDILRGNLQHEDETISTFRQNIFNEIYFSRYFNLNKELKSFDIQEFRDNLVKIQNEIAADGKLSDNLKILGIGLFGGLVGALVGSTKGAATGFLSATTMATTIFSGNKQDISQFQFPWKNNDFIRTLLISFITGLNGSYVKFIDCIVSDVTELIAPIESKINKIQNNLNNIGEELQNFEILLSTNQTF